MNLYQDKFQNIQYFQDQYVAMRKVCDDLEISLGWCESDAGLYSRKKAKSLKKQ